MFMRVYEAGRTDGMGNTRASVRQRYSGGLLKCMRLKFCRMSIRNYRGNASRSRVVDSSTIAGACALAYGFNIKCWSSVEKWSGAVILDKIIRIYYQERNVFTRKYSFKVKLYPKRL